MEERNKSNELQVFPSDDVTFTRDVCVTIVQVFAFLFSLSCFVYAYTSAYPAVGSAFFIAGMGWFVVWAMCKWPRFLIESIVIRRMV